MVAFVFLLSIVILDHLFMIRFLGRRAIPEITSTSNGCSLATDSNVKSLLIVVASLRADLCSIREINFEGLEADLFELALMSLLVYVRKKEEKHSDNRSFAGPIFTIEEPA